VSVACASQTVDGVMRGAWRHCWGGRRGLRSCCLDCGCPGLDSEGGRSPFVGLRCVAAVSQRARSSPRSRRWCSCLTRSRTSSLADLPAFAATEWRSFRSFSSTRTLSWRGFVCIPCSGVYTSSAEQGQGKRWLHCAVAILLGSEQVVAGPPRLRTVWTVSEPSRVCLSKSTTHISLKRRKS
jgi:hypothetical protein